jgi:hypothetical protein
VDSNLDFVLSKYQQYSPMYISMSYSISYALSFAAVTAIVVHTYLYNGSEIWAKVRLNPLWYPLYVRGDMS